MSDLTWAVGTVLFVGWTIGIFALGYRAGVKDEKESRWR
jgi:hypothetical protein